jgi:uncharacterized protein
MKRIKLTHPLSALVLTAALLASGGAASASAALLTEPQLLAALAGKGAQPSLSRVAGTAGSLAASARQLCEKRDAASLEKARGAWREAFLAWRRAEPFLFGPGDKLKRPLGRWPAHELVLDAVVKSKEYGHLRGNADLRGYAGAEYLLFVPKDAAAATAALRCEHLLDVTGEIAGLTGRAQQDWQQHFGKEFVSAGDGKPFLTSSDALSLAFAEMLNVTERLLRERIGTPSGFFKTSVKPDQLEAWHSKSARDAFQATLEGLRLELLGDGTTGVAGLVAVQDGLVFRKDPALAADLVKQLDKIEKTVAGLGGRDLALPAELKQHPTLLKGLYRQIQKLQDQLVQASLVLELDVRGSAEKKGGAGI